MGGIKENNFPGWESLNSSFSCGFVRIRLISISVFLYRKYYIFNFIFSSKMAKLNYCYNVFVTWQVKLTFFQHDQLVSSHQLLDNFLWDKIDLSIFWKNLFLGVLYIFWPGGLPSAKLNEVGFLTPFTILLSIQSDFKGTLSILLILWVFHFFRFLVSFEWFLQYHLMVLIGTEKNLIWSKILKFCVTYCFIRG